MKSSMGTRPAKDLLFDTFARVAASLASGRRLEIVDILAQAPRTVEALAEAIDQTVANTSHHLRRLAEDGLVEAEKTGRHVTYRLTSDDVYELWRALQDVAARHHHGLAGPTEKYVGNREEIEQIDWSTLRLRLDRGDPITVIDVRPEVEYLAGHLDGSISIPPEGIDVMLEGLPSDVEVVAYCRGAYCAYADQAVRRLMAMGRKAYRLDGGYRDHLPGPDL
jgi:DNA-binding transcriptional ArsR family regulator/rhodanese-related sulfurtransferase